MITVCLTSASLPLVKTIRLNETFAVRFVVVNGWGLFITKLKEAPCFDFKAGRSLVPPITHLLDWLTSLPWSSNRKQTAQADATDSARLFVIANVTTAFWPVIFGDEIVTASWACVVITHKNAKQNTI